MKLAVLNRNSSSAAFASNDPTVFPGSSDSLVHPVISGRPRYSGNNFFSFIRTPRASTRKATSDANGSEICLSEVIQAIGLRSTIRISISPGGFQNLVALKSPVGLDFDLAQLVVGVLEEETFRAKPDAEEDSDPERDHQH